MAADNRSLYEQNAGKMFECMNCRLVGGIGSTHSSTFDTSIECVYCYEQFVDK